jgi:hypothetical protein
MEFDTVYYLVDAGLDKLPQQANRRYTLNKHCHASARCSRGNTHET